MLMRTGRCIADGRFPEDWPVLSESCARSLVSRGLRLLGVDAPSVDPRESKELAIHHLLFASGACILENLDLHAVGMGDYELFALPIRMEGLDAAPVRAVLRPLGRE
jgi:arylformamidase